MLTDGALISCLFPWELLAATNLLPISVDLPLSWRFHVSGFLQHVVFLAQPPSLKRGVSGFSRIVAVDQYLPAFSWLNNIPLWTCCL